jgi:hypothetical protein
VRRWVVGEYLGVEDLRGLPVLGGEPVVGQVQVDPGGLDRGVPGLGLHRLQRHPGLPESGQAGVAQLVAGRMREAAAAPRTGQHLVQSLCGQGLPAVGTLEHHEHSVGIRAGWSLGLEVRRDRGGEPGRDRDQPLVTALAVSDEHPPLGDTQVLHPQTEDLAAAQIATALGVTRQSAWERWHELDETRPQASDVS